MRKVAGAIGMAVWMTACQAAGSGQEKRGESPKDVYVVALRHANVEDVSKVLRPFVRGTLEADTKSNSVLLVAEKIEFERVRPLIEALDRRKEPVEFVDVSKTTGELKYEIVEWEQVSQGDLDTRAAAGWELISAYSYHPTEHRPLANGGFSEKMLPARHVFIFKRKA